MIEERNLIHGAGWNAQPSRPVDSGSAAPLGAAVHVFRATTGTAGGLPVMKPSSSISITLLQTKVRPNIVCIEQLNDSDV